MSTVIKRSTIRQVSLAATAALVVGLAATPALAGNDRHRGGDRGGWSSGPHQGHHRHHLPPGHAKRHHHGYAPVYYYAPPPRVVYVPQPVYHPPQPGVTIVFPIDLN